MGWLKRTLGYVLMSPIIFVYWLTTPRRPMD